VEIRFDQRASLAALPVEYTPKGLLIGGNTVVQYWERPVQERLAKVALRAGTKILEIGYGLGMCATELARGNTARHCLVEVHPAIAAAAATALSGHAVEVILGCWPDVVIGSPHFDAVIFDAYPLLDQEYDGSVSQTIAFVRPALTAGATYLNRGGKFLFIDFTQQLEHSHTWRAIWPHAYRKAEYVAVPVAIPSECTYASGNSAVIVTLTK
jgi:hypothetical protein